MELTNLSNERYNTIRSANNELMQNICFSANNAPTSFRTLRKIDASIIKGFSFYDSIDSIMDNKHEQYYNEITIDGCYVSNSYGSNSLRLFKDNDNKLSNLHTSKMIQQFVSSIKRCRNWGTSIENKKLIDLSNKNTISNSTIYDMLFQAKSIEEFVMWMNNEPMHCDFKGLKTRTYRISGDNTYFWDYDEMKTITPMNAFFIDGRGEYRDAIISNSISRKLKKCKCCKRFIYFKKTYISSSLRKRAFTKVDNNIYCFECVKTMPKCKECNRVSIGGFAKNGNCKNCNYDFKTNVHQYGYKPKFKYFDLDEQGKLKTQFVPFYKSNGKKFKLEKTMIGLELEMEKNPNHDTNQTNDEFRQSMSRMIKDKYKNYSFYNTYDSSLNNSGFELHNHPMSFDSWKKINWDFIYDGYNYQSWNDNCGLHIHLNRMSFTPFQMYKMIDFMYSNLNLVCHIANRKNHNYNQWGQFKKSFLRDFKNVLCGSMSHRYDKKYFSNSMGGKYNAINCVASKTFEFRFFGGAIDGDDLRTKIEFLISIKRFVKFNYHMRAINRGITNIDIIQDANKELNKLNVKNYVQYVKDNKKQYKSLNKKFNTNETKIIINDAQSIPSFITL